MKYFLEYFAAAAMTLTTLLRPCLANSTSWKENGMNVIPVTPGATRTNVTYGPFNVGARKMYPHTPVLTHEKPCNDCYLTMMETRLEDTSGNSLNLDSGVWLHHLMQFNNNQTDLVCPSLSGHYFYGSGNERPVWRLNANGEWGYYVHPTDQWVTAVEIMNERPNPVDVQVTVTYEWVPASSDEGKKYKDAELIWVNIGPPCGDGEVSAEPGRTTYVSDVWVSTVSGPILEARGHMHDGGKNVTLYINGVPVCKSQQTYGRRPGYSSPNGVHLSRAGACYEAGEIRKGDKLHIVAQFDEENHPIMQHHGQKDKIMAVMFMYVGISGIDD
jgi:hypothetical protein